MLYAEYVSGELFSKISDVSIFDAKHVEQNPSLIKFSNNIIYKGNKFDKNIILNSKIFYVKSDYLNFFEKDILPHISHGFILISHESDYTVGLHTNIIQNKYLVKWFGENMIPHHNTCCIPIGLENTYSGRSNYDICKKNYNNKKDKLLYFNFSLKTNNERKNIEAILLQTGFIKNINKNWNDYIEELSTYRFCIAPEGNGIDTHRLWECIYVGCIPIVKKNSILYTNFYDLPILWVDNYNIITEEFLLKQDIISIKNNIKKSTLNYWVNIFKTELNL